MARVPGLAPRGVAVAPGLKVDDRRLSRVDGALEVGEGHVVVAVLRLDPVAPQKLDHGLGLGAALDAGLERGIKGFFLHGSVGFVAPVPEKGQGGRSPAAEVPALPDHRNVDEVSGQSRRRP